MLKDAFKKTRVLSHKLLKNKYLRAFLILLFFGLITVFLRSNQVLVKNYSCKTQYGPTCDAKDQELLKKYVGANFFTIDTKTVENDLRTNFINERILVQKVIPAKLTAFIVKRKPIVAAKMTGQETFGYFLVDKKGQVLNFVPDSTLGVLLYKQEEHNLVVGSSSNDKFKAAATILYQSMRTFGAKTASLEGSVLKVELPENILVNYPLDRDPAVLGVSLQLILTRSTIDNKLPRIIDLRYKNPVLTY